MQFTEEAQEIAQLAAEIIQRYSQNQIDIEHILLALFEQPNGIVPQILANRDVDIETLAVQLDKILQASPKANIFGNNKQIFITPRLKRIIDLAKVESRRLHDDLISSEHIFLSTFSEKKTPAIRVLQSANLSYEKVDEWIQKARKQNISQEKSKTKSHEEPIINAKSLQVFLCHSSGDKPKVRELYHRLSKDGINPWLDEEDLLPGHDWQIEIPKAVRNSDVVIVCLSKASITKTGYVQKEIRQALDVADEQIEGTIFIIPLKIEECEVPKRLSRWQWVNLFEDTGYQRLLRSLRIRADEKSRV